MTRSRRSRNRKKRQLRSPRLTAVRWPRLRVNWTAVLVPPVVIGCAVAGGAAVDVVLDRPVARLVVEGTFQRVSLVQIEAALAAGIGDGFLSLDLEDLRRRAQALPWIDRVTLRRAWPDTLVVRVTEHRAAARWGDAGLLNERGELFAERPAHAFPELPKLAGPEGSERDVAAFYLRLREPLDAAHLEIGALTLDERGAWRLTLETGQEVRLGRRDVEGRVKRFFDVAAPALAHDLARIEYVDLRYTNGFAVGWRDAEPESEAETGVATRHQESPSRG